MKIITDRISIPFFALCIFGLAMGIIPLNDALIKLMSGDVSLGQLVALRAGMTLIMLGIFSRSIQAMFALPAKVLWLFFARSMCLVLAMVLFFVSLGTLPLANVIAIFPSTSAPPPLSRSARTVRMMSVARWCTQRLTCCRG